MELATRNRIFSFLIMAAILLVTASMLFVIYSLKNRAEAGYKSEELAQSIKSNSNALNALEWQAIGTGKMETAIKTEIDERRADVDGAIDTLATQAPAEANLTKIRQTFDGYKEATDQEFALLSSGRIPDAIAIDEESVDPLFERLVETATETATANHERAVSDNNLSYYLIAMTCLLTVLTAGILMWLYLRTLRNDR